MNSPESCQYYLRKSMCVASNYWVHMQEIKHILAVWNVDVTRASDCIIDIVVDIACASDCVGSRPALCWASHTPPWQTRRMARCTCKTSAMPSATTTPTTRSPRPCASRTRTTRAVGVSCSSRLSTTWEHSATSMASSVTWMEPGSLMPWWPPELPFLACCNTWIASAFASARVWGVPLGQHFVFYVRNIIYSELFSLFTCRFLHLRRILNIKGSMCVCFLFCRAHDSCRHCTKDWLIDDVP